MEKMNSDDLILENPDQLEDEAVVGNVQNLRVCPPDHMGRPKRGHLVFNANFESGNLGRVDYVSDCEYDLFIRPDTCNPRQRVWFYFTISNVRKEQRVIFNLINFSKTKSLYRMGMAPVVRSTSRPKWQRIPPRHVYYYKSPNHQMNYVMSFAFAFDRDEDIYYFAYCFPYTYTQLQSYLAECEALKLPFFYRDLLGMTVQQRRLDLITITDPANISVSSKQRLIFVTARVHPGESPASFICQGFISFLLSDHYVAKKLREHFVFKIVPMLNADGVFLGNYRCSLMGFDLNRHWQSPSAWAHPTLHATKNLLLQYDRNPNQQLDFYIDIHAHSTQLNSFMYGNIFTNDASRSERQIILPTLLAEMAEDFSLDNTAFNTDPVKAGTGRRTMGGSLESFCYTLEVSFFGYTRPDNANVIVPYTEEGYKRLGENLANSFYRFLEAEETGKHVQTRPFNSFATVQPKEPGKKGSKKAKAK